MRKLRKGDEVIVITGRDKGRKGRVLRVLASSRVIVEGCNVVKKHQRPNPQAGQAGGIVDKEVSLHASNVQLFNPIGKRGDRVGFKQLKDGKKVRFYKSTGEVVDA